MSEWIRCPNCGTVMTVTTSGYLCPMCGTALPVKILHMTSGTSPEVDAVPVIRCRDCAYYSMNGRYRGESKHCVLYFHETHEVNGDDFCSRGERR